MGAIVAQPARELEANPIAQISRTFNGGFGPVSLPLFQGVLGFQLGPAPGSSDTVCLLGGCRGGRMVAGGYRGALVSQYSLLVGGRQGTHDSGREVSQEGAHARRAEFLVRAPPRWRSSGRIVALGPRPRAVLSLAAVARQRFT
jgi:hypothetical protein